MAQICQEVRDWVKSWLPKHRAAGDPGTLLHVVIVLRRMQLEAADRPYLACFGGIEGTLAWYLLQQASDEGRLKADLVDRLPPRDWLQSAMRMVVELDALQQLAERGPLRDRLEELRAGLPAWPATDRQVPEDSQAPEEEQAIHARATAEWQRVWRAANLLDQFDGEGNNVNNRRAALTPPLAAQSVIWQGLRRCQLANWPRKKTPERK